MSDLSPQFAPQIALLLAPAQAGGQPAAALSRAPGAAFGVTSGAPARSAETDTSIDFAQALQALLARVESAAPVGDQPLPASLPGNAGGTPAFAGAVSADGSADPRAVAALALTAAAGGKPLPVGGNALPPGGNSLPPAGLNPEPADPAGEALPGATGAARATPAADAALLADADGPAALQRSAAGELLSRILSGEAPPRPAAELTPAAERSADARALNAASVLPAVPEVLRQSQSAVELRLRTVAELRALAGGEAEAFRGALGDLLAARADNAKITALADTAAQSGQSQFSLGSGRADGLITLPQPAAADSVLRDLQSMLPLRPQTGEANPAFARGLGQRLVMLAENGIESARLRLNPASLGALDIQISVEDDRAQVSFGVQHSTTREALEAALPRLRELFAAQGLQLTQADVQDRSADTSAERDSGQSRGAGVVGPVAVADPSAGASLALSLDGSRALDIYV